MNKPETLKAFIKVQKEIGSKIKKDSENPHFKNGFVSLKAAIEHTKEALNDHGFILMQSIEDEQMLTRFMHENGDIITSSYPFSGIPADPQKTASASTYARRYCLMQALGLAPADDDGEGAEDRRKVLKPNLAVFQKVVDAVKSGKKKISDLHKYYIIDDETLKALEEQCNTPS